ncbi:MAG TPA: hypothetical protein PK402_12180, partial [Tepidisphaeraceae bacterium]|nr:hypothetical protein [Tepidisphaeraceae bacterium]
MNAKLASHPDTWLLDIRSLHEGTIGKSASAAAGIVGRPKPASAGGPTASGSYLESRRNTITIGKPRIEIRSCGCKNWFCSRCCTSLGLNLRRKLLPIIERWKHPMMLTLTIDPQLFESPDAAFRFVTDRSCIGRTMQHLRRAGVLNGVHWFAVIEWQANGWPHWHLLVDADRIPFDVLTAAWNQNWSKSAERIALGRPGFGSVRFTRPRFKDARHAASYATKYLIKHP